MELTIRRMGMVLSLKVEEDSRVTMPGGSWQAKSLHNQMCLVGRLLVNRRVRFDALCTSVQGMLDSMKGMEIRQLDEGRFLNRALGGCP
ncbi:UNVERIFIED_CONTAM: hypothetical protein Sradi_2627000 [Sesamum radiatum]|uniref:Uncharacterized protein n=1 Tax=Sesamum radiatum TaxID=300843 RepID=A0AAW2S4T0_SESRA